MSKDNSAKNLRGFLFFHQNRIRDNVFKKEKKYKIVKKIKIFEMSFI